MPQVEDDFIQHLQLLQDLKFLIAEYSDYRLGYQNMRIFEITVDTRHIDLVAEYHRYQPDHSLKEVAHLIVIKYHL